MKMLKFYIICDECSDNKAVLPQINFPTEPVPNEYSVYIEANEFNKQIA